MKYLYDAEADALYVALSDRAAVESEEVWPGIVVDFDREGRPVGLDIDSGASAIVDVRGLATGREIRISGPGLVDGETILNGPDLRLQRESLGLTQAELAAELGTTANTIARWERGELRIENPTMLGLAIAHLRRTSEDDEQIPYALPSETPDSIRDRPASPTHRPSKARRGRRGPAKKK